MVSITFLYGPVVNCTLPSYTVAEVMAFFAVDPNHFADPQTTASLRLSTGPVCDTVCFMGNDGVSRYILAPTDSFDVDEFIGAKTSDDARIYA